MDRDKMTKSIESDFSAPIKDIKLKFGIQSFLAMRNKLMNHGKYHRE